MKLSKTIAYFLVVISIMVGVYILIEAVPSADANPDMVRRRIETPIKLWLNGYLGSFFNFFAVGNLTWVSLIFIPYYCFQKGKLQSWEKAMVFFLFLGVIIIGVGGYFNSRYQLTLMPFFVGAIFFVISKFVVNKNIRYGMFLFILISTCFNFSYYAYSNFWLKYQDRMVQMLEAEGNTNSIITTVDFLKKLNIDSTEAILVNAMPEFYYYTDKRGVYFQSIKDIYYTKNGSKILFGNKKLSEVKKIITDDLKCRYIYSYKGLHLPNLPFTRFLEEKCDLLQSDVAGRMVYRIK